MSICSQCGRPKPTSSAVSLHPPPYNVLEIERIDRQIHERHQRKAFLQRQLNMVQPSTSVFPPDILSLIFKYACTIPFPSLKWNRKANMGFGRMRQTMRLGGVCSQWRRIVWSIPTLWTTLIMNLKGYIVGEDAAALLKLCLRNAGTLSLTLDLFWHPRSPNHSTEYHIELLQPLCDAIFDRENAKRIKVLCLDDVFSNWTNHLSADLPNLEILTLDSLQFLNETTLSNAPRLRQLTIRSCGLVHIARCQSITVLTLYFEEMADCIPLLIQCPNLIEFYCRVMAAGSREINIDSTITLPHLEIFEWPGVTSQGDDSLFRHLRLPALKKLLLEGGSLDTSSPTDGETGLDVFFTNLPSTLRSLELEGFECVDPVAHFFSCVYGVEELLLLGCSEDFMEEAVKLLALGGSIGNDVPQPIAKYLPDLHVLSVSGHHNILKPLCTMVESRYGMGSPFALKLARVKCDVKAFAEKFAGEGYDIQLLPKITSWAEGLPGPAY